MKREILKNIKKDRNEPELKPIAQTNTLCEKEFYEFGSFEWSGTTAERLMKVSKELAMLFIFQYESGCRISECLSAKHENITRTGSIKIIGAKGSKDRLIECSRIASYLLMCRKMKINPFCTFNRFFIHRQYKKFGIEFQSETSKKKSTTHSLRQLKAESLRQIESENNFISESLGQKNHKNAQFYGKAKK